MSPLVFVVRSRVRARWRHMVALVVAAGIGFGLSAGVLVVARRTNSAPERIAASTSAVHYSFNHNVTTDLVLLDRASTDVRFGDLRRWVGFVEAYGADGAPDILAPFDHDTVIEQPFTRRGELPVGELDAMLNESAAEVLAVDVGDAMPLGLFTADYTNAVAFEFTVSGIGTMAIEEGLGDDVDAVPVIILSRAFAESHPELILWAGSGGVLPAGPTSRQAVSEFLVDYNWGPASVLPERLARVRSAVRPTVMSLFVVGITGLVATALVTSLVMARIVDRGYAERSTLRALGMRRRAMRDIDATLIAALGAGIALVAGCLAVAASRVGSAGLVAQYDTAHPLAVDSLVLVVVGVTLAATGGLAFLLAAGASSAPPARPSRQPLAVALLANGSGQSRRIVFLTFALSGIALAAAAGTVPLFTSLDRLVERPERYGQPWDVIGRNRFGNVSPVATDELVADPDIASVTAVVAGQVVVNGEVGVDAAGYRVLKGDDEVVIIDGRRPSSPREILMGRRTLDLLGVDVGDEIRLSTGISELLADSTGPAPLVPVTIVGTAIFPAVGSPGGAAPRLDSGLWLPLDAWGAVHGVDDLPEVVLVDVVEGARLSDVIARHDPMLDMVDGVTTEWFVDSQPAEVRSAAQARAWVLWGLCALVVVVSAILGLGLRTIVRGQARDFAVLRAIGASPRTVRGLAMRQGIALLGPTLVVSVPIGFGIGRLLFVRLARRTGVVAAPSTPWWAAAWFVAAVTVMAIGSMMIAARSAQRVAPAVTLREL